VTLDKRINIRCTNALFLENGNLVVKTKGEKNSSNTKKESKLMILDIDAATNVDKEVSFGLEGDIMEYKSLCEVPLEIDIELASTMTSANRLDTENSLTGRKSTILVQGDYLSAHNSISHITVSAD
jgi:hypothetical protein